MKADFLEKLKPLKREQWQLIEDLVDLWLKRKEEYSPSDQQDPFVEKPLEVYSPKLDYSPADLQAIADSYPKDTLWTHTLLQKVFPFEYRVKVQIINHKLYIMASPTETHQDITLDLAHNLKSYAIKHQLGKVIMGPYDTRLADNQLVQPDILFIALRRQEISDGNKVNGSPDLVVEVISPSNYPKLRKEKKRIYESYDVAEYWEIHPPKRSCQIFILEKGKFQIQSEAKGSGNLKSKVLEGFEMSIDTLFAPIDRLNIKS